MDDVRPGVRVGRLLRWSLAGAALLALGGCLERHEPANPFIGPYGSAEAEPFALAPVVPIAGDSTLIVAARHRD